MARPAAVTYEKVAQIAAELAESTKKRALEISAQEVRAELVRRSEGQPVGSPTTIHRHLLRWREGAVAPLPPATAEGMPKVEIPLSMQSTLQAWVTSQHQPLYAQVSERLAQAQSELKAAVETSVNLESERDAMADDLQEARIEARRLQETLAEATSQRDELKTQIAAALERAGALERELSAAQASEKAAVGRVDEIRAAADKRTGELQAEIEALRGQLATAVQERTVASEAAAVAKASLAGESRRADQAEARETALAAELKALREQASSASTQLAAALEREGAHKVRLAELSAQVERLTGKAGAEKKS